MAPVMLQAQPWDSSSNKYNKSFAQPLTDLPVSHLSSHLVGVQVQGRPVQAVAMVGAGAAALPSNSTYRDTCPGMQI